MPASEHAKLAEGMGDRVYCTSWTPSIPAYLRVPKVSSTIRLNSMKLVWRPFCMDCRIRCFRQVFALTLLPQITKPPRGVGRLSRAKWRAVSAGGLGPRRPNLMIA